MHLAYRLLDGINDWIGRTVAWFTLLMVLIQFVLVLMRYIFSAADFLGISTLWWQEAIVYLHGALIMLGAGYTFLHNGHVRVDIFYSKASERMKDVTDLLGSMLFLLPVCYVVWWSAWPNVELSWRQGEGSTESSGIPYKYLLKTTVLCASALLAIQALSTMIKAGMRLAGYRVDDPYRNEETME